MLCPTEQAEKVVGIDRGRLFAGLHTERFAQVVGNERAVVFLAWHNAFFHIEQQQVVEIERTRFEHTHHLNIGNRLAVERQRHALHRATHNAAQERQRIDQFLIGGVAQQGMQLIELELHLIDRLLDEQGLPRLGRFVFRVLLFCLYLFGACIVLIFLVGNIDHIVQYPLNDIGIGLALLAVVFRVRQVGYHIGVDLRAGDREPFGDVDIHGSGIVTDFQLRQRIDDWLQHLLIAYHDSGTLSLFGVVFAQPWVDILRLCVGRRGSNDMYLLFCPFRRSGCIGELLHILLNERIGFLVGLKIRHIVPIETSVLVCLL